MRPLIYLNLDIRNERGERSGGEISLPLNMAWQEGPEDLHVHLATSRSSVSLVAESHEVSGDYVIPYHKCLGSRNDLRLLTNYRWHPDYGSPVEHDGVLVYCLVWSAKPYKGCLAPKSYVRLVESLWYSPNR